MWFDSHCHLQEDPDPASALERAEGAGVGAVVCVGTGPQDSRKALALSASSQAEVWATVGLHPHDARSGTGEVEALLRASAREERLVAVGECGLDYHYDNSPRQDQREAFAQQVALARCYDLTLVVHTRDAWSDTFGVLQAEGVPDRVVFHCFTGGPVEARRCLDLDAFLSFSGIATFPRATEVREAAALCPAERLLVETDSPFLAPVPRRGGRNEPSLLPLVGAAVAAARSEPVEELEESSWAATRAAFGLDGSGHR